MTNKERLIRADSVMRRQNSGKLSQWDASAEMDKLLDEATGDLHFYSDSTGLRECWDGQDVMVFPTMDSTFPGVVTASNTAIVTQGDKRGLVVLKNGETETNAHQQCLDLWGHPGERKYRP